MACWRTIRLLAARLQGQQPNKRCGVLLGLSTSSICSS